VSQVSNLLNAIRSGFLLAGLLTCGCGGSSLQNGGVSAPVLPKDRELTCPGPHYPDAGGGYSGSCCEHMVCRAQPEGGCPQGNDGHTYGSGSCLCAPIEGPFTIADDDPRFAVERQQGPCCYITTYVSCVGRPLVIAEAMRVAPVVVRGDWC
jgi:hypothetical protein